MILCHRTICNWELLFWWLSAATHESDRAAAAVHTNALLLQPAQNVSIMMKPCPTADAVLNTEALSDIVNGPRGFKLGFCDSVTVFHH